MPHLESAILEDERSLKAYFLRYYATQRHAYQKNVGKYSCAPSKHSLTFVPTVPALCFA